jgi:hypothetical protein
MVGSSPLQGRSLALIRGPWSTQRNSTADTSGPLGLLIFLAGDEWMLVEFVIAPSRFSGWGFE